MRPLISILLSLSALACVPNERKNQSPPDAGQPAAANPFAAPHRVPQKLGPAPVARPPELVRAPEDMAGAASAAPNIGDGAATAARSLDAARPSERAKPTAQLKQPFIDAFERSELGPNWNATSPVWQLQGGRVCVRNAKNHPLWLLRRLPTNARIEFEATSSSPDGDIKAEFWGDGKAAAAGVSYTDASSYITIFGGWKNQFHVLARIDEHAKGRPEIKIDPTGADLRARPVVANQAYQFKVERSDGKTVRWFVDDIELLSFSDPKPLRGTGHDHFAFNNWEVPLCFDNLKITPLEGD